MQLAKVMAARVHVLMAGSRAVDVVLTVMLLPLAAFIVWF